MDVEPEMKQNLKSADWLEPNSDDSMSIIKKTSFFNLLYFWCVYLLTISFCVDMLLYLFYYQKTFEIVYYDKVTFILRAINNTLFVFPLLIFWKLSDSENSDHYIYGILALYPQFVLTLIGVIKIFKQDYCTDDDILCYYEPNDDVIIRRLNHTRITCLRISTLINLIIYFLTVVLTFLKIKFNI